MTVRIYRSTDASAPTLSGSAGALLTVLDAVLVNGYGSTTAAGWTIAYTGTNKRQYAMVAGGTGCQLYVDDSAPGAAGAKEARLTGFKTGTGLGAGTGQFPTTSQMTAPSGALVARKSSTADSTARAWTIIADGHTIYMFVETGDVTTPALSYPWMFGDFFSYSASDTSNCAIIARSKENWQYYGSANDANGWTANSGMVENFNKLGGLSNTYLNDVLTGHYCAANYTGVGGSLQFGKHSDIAAMGHISQNGSPQMGYLGKGPNGGVSVWPSEFAYPNPADSGLYTAPVWIHHGGGIRGYLKGVWNPLQHVPLSTGDTYSGTGNLSGKSFIAFNIIGSQNSDMNNSANQIPTQVHIEYSDTWS